MMEEIMRSSCVAEIIVCAIDFLLMILIGKIISKNAYNYVLEEFTDLQFIVDSFGKYIHVIIVRKKNNISGVR